MARPTVDCAYAPPVAPQIASAARTPHLIILILSAICVPMGFLVEFFNAGTSFGATLAPEPTPCWDFDAPASIGPRSNRGFGCVGFRRSAISDSLFKQPNTRA